MSMIDLETRLLILSLLNQSVGASLEGQQYLLTKSLLGNSTALNAAIYLLLKSDIEEIDRDNSIGEKSSSSIQAHPVMAQLQKCNTSDERFKEEVTGQVKNIDDQVNYLVKAAALMTSPDQKLDEDSDASTPESEQNDSADENASDSYLNETSDHIEHKSLTVHESSEALKEKEDVLLHEARFGLRASEVNSKSGKGKPKRKSADDTYFGDLEETEAQGNTRFLASTINSIEQRSKKKKKTALVEEIDDTEADSGLAQGLKMMEEELGKLERNDDKVGDFDKDKEVYDDNMASVEGSNEGAMKFYNAVANRSKEKKMIKKKRYQVAPKFPVTDAEVPGERAISKAIMKNRGLVPHKAKINRNPRVKKREQYRKALIRRKGAVREIRTDEGHKYGGEGTGIKSAISRSRKL
jgi:U3 small nucleolar RNA-associated protein 3